MNKIDKCSNKNDLMCCSKSENYKIRLKRVLKFKILNWIRFVKCYLKLIQRLRSALKLQKKWFESDLKSDL